MMSSQAKAKTNCYNINININSAFSKFVKDF